MRALSLANHNSNNSSPSPISLSGQSSGAASTTTSSPSIGISGAPPRHRHQLSVDLLTSMKDLAYSPPIRKLQQLSEFKTVSKKLRCLVDASKAIIRCVDEYYRPFTKMYPDSDEEDEEDKMSTSAPSTPENSKNKQNNNNNNNNNKNNTNNNNNNNNKERVTLGAEDKFPIFLYCLIKANIPNLYAEMGFIKEFGDPIAFKEEAMYRLIELEQSMEYIESLDWNVYDVDGVLASVSMIERNMLDSIRMGRESFYRKRGEYPRLLWVAELLLVCGTRADDKLSDFNIGREYVANLAVPEYLQLANLIFAPIDIKFLKEPLTPLIPPIVNTELSSPQPVIQSVATTPDGMVVRLHFIHRYPQYVYSRIASTVEHEIKKDNTTRPLRS